MHATYIRAHRQRKLPAIEAEVHDRLRVAADDTTTSIRRQPVEHALANLLREFWRQDRRETTEPAIPVALLVDGLDLVLDALGYDLEQLLRVLVFTGVEQGVGPPGGGFGEDLDNVRGLQGGVAFVGGVEF